MDADAIFITGIGSYLPRRMLEDGDVPLDEPMAAEEREKIGVRRRGRAGEGESIPEMAAAAARRALARAALDPEDLDVVILANWTQRRFLPDFAPRLQALLGARRAFAFDVGTACAGFVYGLAIARAFLREARFRHALVVAAETTSQRGRPGSKSMLIFGDGAGAFVLERGAERGGQLIDTELQTDGAYFDMMEIDAAGHVKTKLPQRELNALAAKSFAQASRRLLERNGLRLDDLDWIVPHSGTAGIQATLVRALEVPAEKVLSNFASIGNVSSAAIPLALDEHVTSGRIAPGSLILSPTTGSGWYAAAMLYTVGV